MFDSEKRTLTSLLLSSSRTKSARSKYGTYCLSVTNMVLDGLQEDIDKALDIRRRDKYRTYKNPHKIHLVQYADDFIITASSKEVLQKQVKPVLQDFLIKRGLELSKDKTFITHIDEGFDFLGKNIRKYKGKLIIKPSKKNVQTFLRDIQQTIRQHRTCKTLLLIYRLNDMIRGWAMYHRMDNSKQTFQYVDARIWWMLWKWAIRRHLNKNKGWVKQRYYKK